MAHGNVYAAEKIDAALTHYFRVGNLTALRELALLWVGRPGRRGARPLPRRARASSSRGRRASASSSRSPAAPRARRCSAAAARIAERAAGRELLAVHVARNDGLTRRDPGSPWPASESWSSPSAAPSTPVVGDDVAEALVDFARGVNATQLVVGVSRRGRLERMFGRGVGDRDRPGSGEIDVHIVTHDEVGRGGTGTASPGALATTRGRGLGAGHARAVAARRAAVRVARRSLPQQRPAALPDAHRGRRPGRRALAGARRGRGVEPACSTGSSPRPTARSRSPSRRTSSPSPSSCWSPPRSPASSTSPPAGPSRPRAPRARRRP